MAIDLAYAETVHWCLNISKVPFSKVGQAFIAETGHLFCVYAESTTLEPVALKCVMTMPALLHQTPH